MFTTLRKFTVIFLAILQLIAPLVHAHAGEKSPDRGLHVPGLEMYGAEHDTLLSQAISYSFSSYGIIVGVDAGIKDNKANLPQTPVFNPTLAPFDNNFTPQTAQFICRLFIPSLSPRAPPAQ